MRRLLLRLYHPASVFVTASVIPACVVYHCVGMYPAYICIFQHESADDNIILNMKQQATLLIRYENIFFQTVSNIAV